MLTYKFDWAIVTSGKYFDWLVSGFYVTIKLSAVSIALSFLLGLIMAAGLALLREGLSDRIEDVEDLIADLENAFA